jgi:hypothetical protein
MGRKKVQKKKGRSTLGNRSLMSDLFYKFRDRPHFIGVMLVRCRDSTKRFAILVDRLCPDSSEKTYP